MITVFALVIACFLGTFLGTVFAASAAHASTVNIGARALDWAEAHATGAGFAMGGAGPGVYDCSGLVMVAFEHEGIALPHYTVAMVRNPHLVRVYGTPRRGDLAFFGPVGAPTHVDFVTIWHNGLFGAYDYGQSVGWNTWGWGWIPTAFYRVVG